MLSGSVLAQSKDPSRRVFERLTIYGRSVVQLILRKMLRLREYAPLSMTSLRLMNMR